MDPVAEWKQMYHEVWRIERDYFYDPGFHGADWKAMRAKYQPFLPDLASRADLTRLIQWMCSELAVGQLGVEKELVLTPLIETIRLTRSGYRRPNTEAWYAPSEAPVVIRNGLLFRDSVNGRTSSNRCENGPCPRSCKRAAAMPSSCGRRWTRARAARMRPRVKFMKSSASGR